VIIDHISIVNIEEVSPSLLDYMINFLNFSAAKELRGDHESEKAWENSSAKLFERAKVSRNWLRRTPKTCTMAEHPNKPKCHRHVSAKNVTFSQISPEVLKNARHPEHAAYIKIRD
jgi:hypothetical protein